MRIKAKNIQVQQWIRLDDGSHLFVRRINRISDSFRSLAGTLYITKMGRAVQDPNFFFSIQDTDTVEIV